MVASSTSRTDERKALTRELAHPVLKGKRYKVTAATRAELDAHVALVKRIGHEVRFGVLEEAKALAMLNARRAPAVEISGVWAAYVKATKTRRARDEAWSIWLHRCAPFFDGFHVSRMTEGVMREWESWLASNAYSATSIRIAAERLKTALRRAGLAVPWGAWTPTAGAPSAPREKATSVAELAALVREAGTLDAERIRRTGDHADLAYRIVVKALCGLRQGELAALGFDHVDLDRVVVTMRLTVQTTTGWRKAHPEWTRPQDERKFGARTTQLVHPAAILVLRWQREALRARGLWRDDGPVFPTRAGAWRSRPVGIEGETFAEVVRRAGLANPSRWVVHSLRHSMAALEAQGGASLAEIARRTGWGSLQMAEHYATQGPRYLPASRIDAGDALAALRADGWNVDALGDETASLVDVLLDVRERAAVALADWRMRALEKPPAAPRVLAEETALARAMEAYAETLRSRTWGGLARAERIAKAPQRAEIALEVRRRIDRAAERARDAFEAACGGTREEIVKAGKIERRRVHKVWTRARLRARKAAETKP